MTYSERFSDRETRQIYADLVLSSMGHCPGSESAMFIDLLSATHIDAPPHRAAPRFSWRSILRMPVFGLPFLT